MLDLSDASSPLIARPGVIGPMRLKNRIIMGPMGTNYGTTDGFSTDRDKGYYAERAKGGVAMIITEAMNIAEGARNHNNSLCIFHDRFIPGLAAVVQAIKDNGAVAVAQLNHRGQLLRRSVLGAEPVGPMNGKHPATGEPVRALRIDEIRQIQSDFVNSARRLQRAGYDAVEIHAANGYLFQQFFTERFNRRDDIYGGSLENRMRLLLETVKMMKDALPGFEILVRISATEYVEGGYTEAEAVALALALQDAGVAALDLSGGSNESPLLSRYCIQPPSFARRCLEPYVKPFKDALTIPTIIAGRIITAEDAEGVLAAGSADYVSLGRALIADPHWTLKALGKLAAPIRSCISCNVCFERLTLEKDVSCVVNPMVGTEFESLARLEPQLGPPPAPARRRRVLVVGAGVAGVEAARMAAALGHEVEIWERAGKAGGQVPLAVAGPDKADVIGVWDYRLDALHSLGVTIRTGREGTGEAIRAHAPDLVILATGARPRQPPGRYDIDVPVIQSWDVLLRPEMIAEGSVVTIVGGGMVGIETADILGARGCQVTVVHRGASVALGMARNNRFDLLERLEKAQVTILLETTIDEVIDGQFLLRTQDQVRRLDPGAAVVLAIGPDPEVGLVEDIEALGIPYACVGDCNRPSDFMGAIRDASMVAMTLETL